MDSFFDVEFAICALQVLIGALGSTTSDVQVTTRQTTGCHTSRASRPQPLAKGQIQARIPSFIMFVILPFSNIACVGEIEI